MDIRYFLTILGVTLVGGVIGRYIASGLRAKNIRIVPRIRVSEPINQALLSVCAFTFVFSLAQDSRTLFGTDWDLWISDSLGAKYGFLLGVGLLAGSSSHFRQKIKSDGPDEVDSKKDTANST